MDVKRFNIDGKEVEFINQSGDTRHGFKHISTLLVGYCQYEHTCYYLNRTWECYNYQSAMLGAARELLDRERARVKHSFMIENNYQKLTAARREALEKIEAQDSGVIFANKLIEEVKNARFLY